MNRQTDNRKLSSDVYSEGERGWMEAGQKLRGYVLSPLLRALSWLRISPDSITVLSGLIGLCFVPLSLIQWNVAALFCLLLHVLLDGLDGPLARHQNVDSPRGSFTDTFADQVVLTAVTIAWMISNPGGLNIANGSIYIFLYAALVAMAMVRNAMQIPFSWLIRPRFFVYVALAIEMLFGYPLTWVVLLICNLAIALKCISGFIILRKNIPGPDA